MQELYCLHDEMRLRLQVGKESVQGLQGDLWECSTLPIVWWVFTEFDWMNIYIPYL